jgi:cytochrome c
MKKTLIILGLSAMIAACSNNSKPGLAADSASAANQSAAGRQSEGAQDSSVNNIGTEHTGGAPTKGAQLIASQDCLGCHKEQDKLVGPAYKDVAKKYSNNDKDINYLANKIISGGKGVWGDVAMTPHPSLAVNDAKEMAKYILSLK